MTTAIITLLTLVESLLPALLGSSASSIDAIIAALISLIPQIEQEAPAVIANIQNLISTLQGSSTLTADQITQLGALSAAADAAYQAAAQADGLATPAASA